MTWRSWWLAWRMWLWMLAVEARRRQPVPRLVAFVRPRRSGVASPHDSDLDRILALAQTTTRFVTRRPETACLIRSLVTYRYLCRAGLSPELRIGLAREGTYDGHAWIEVDGRAVTDRPRDLTRYTPVLAFASNGRESRL